MSTVYVSGHKNPDTDSICSAIAYANLLNSTKKYEAMPVRLGNVSLETQYVLDYFNIQVPELLKTVRQTVGDLKFDHCVKFASNFTLKTAWDLMKEKSLKTAPIVDENSKLLGILSSTSLIEGYMGGWDNHVLATSKTPLENIIEVLAAKCIYRNEEDTCYEGEIQIASMSSKEMKNRINAGDIVLVGGDRTSAIQACIDQKVGLIVLTGNLVLDETLAKAIKEANITAILTPYNTYQASQIIVQAVPVSYVMETKDIVSVHTSDSIDQVKEVMAETKYHNYPVLDEQENVVGTLSRVDLIADEKKKIIQVDHNERGQAVDGIEEAEILEVIDHHRVADFSTMSPLYFRAEPLGCTATIVTKMYREQGVEITKEMAGLMLGAIISDSLLFKSPTCTPLDKETGLELAKIAGVDVETFGMDMFKAGTSLKGKTVAEIFNADYKPFKFGENKVGIGQVNSMDIDGFLPLKDEMLAYMNQHVEENGLDFAMLLVTDIINANSEVFVAGKEELVEKAFNCKLVEHQATLPGVISRKKQVVPAVTALY